MTVEEEFIVESVNDNEIILKGKTKIITYYDNSNLIPGDKIKAKVKILEFSKSSFIGDFDAESYYKSKGITNRGRLLGFEVINHFNNLNYYRYRIKDFYKNKLDEKTFNYLDALIFGNNNFSSDLKSAYSSLYISHILAISGMHITFFFQALVWLFRKIFNIEGNMLSLVIIGIYIVFIDFPLSAVRAFLFLFFDILNKGIPKYTKLDILSLSFLFMAFSNPNSVYQNSLILSFLVSFILIFINEFNPQNSKLFTMFKNSLICIFITFPFVINQTNEVSILGIIMAFGLSFIIGRYILFFMVIVLIFPSSYYEYFFILFDNILLFLAEISLKIRMPSFNIYQYIIYYILFFKLLLSLLKRKSIVKNIAYLLIFLLISINLRLVNPTYRITFIDVGQGDSCLIELPFNKGNLLIDSFNNLDYLKSTGIKRIDYIILTHFDNDHINTAKEVIDNFNVNNLIYSYYEDKEIVKGYECLNKYPVKSGDYFYLDNIKFEILGPIKDYEERNSISICLKFSINELSFLFTGDMTIEEELDLINKYGNTLASDILKVGHHGSSTSSSDAFLSYVLPKVSIVSVGKDNNYGLPNQEVISRLSKKSTVYYTMDSGNIELKVWNKFYKISEFR